MYKMLIAILVFGAVAAPGGKSVYDFTMNSIDGEPTSLSKFQGKVVLLVNVASRCGFTPQYSALEKVYEQYKDRGFVIVGIPANNFGGQEPGDHPAVIGFHQVGGILGLNELGRLQDALEDLRTVVFLADRAQVRP